MASATITPPQTGGHVITDHGGKKFLVIFVGADPEDETNIFSIDVLDLALLDCDNPSWICDEQCH